MLLSYFGKKQTNKQQKQNKTKPTHRQQQKKQQVLKTYLWMKDGYSELNP